jgi:hypothetical protein
LHRFSPFRIPNPAPFNLRTPSGEIRPKHEAGGKPTLARAVKRGESLNPVATHLPSFPTKQNAPNVRALGQTAQDFDPV